MTTITTDIKEPAGVVGIFTDKLGRVIASEADFERSGFGGCSLFEAQKHRVQQRLVMTVVHGYCSDIVAEVLEHYECERIVRKLIEKGARVSFVPIGHPKQKAEGHD